MLDPIHVTPEALRQMEPPEEAMVQRSEPADKPFSFSEGLFFGVVMILVGLTLFINWSPLHTTAMIIALGFVGLECFYLLIPPRLSWTRITMLSTLLGTRLFFH